VVLGRDDALVLCGWEPRERKYPSTDTRHRYTLFIALVACFAESKGPGRGVAAS
jgi:hypothetical protein